MDCSGIRVDGSGLSGSEVNGSVVEFKWVQWKCNGSGVMKMEVGSMFRVEVGSMEVWCSGSGVSGSGAMKVGLVDWFSGSVV